MHLVKLAVGIDNPQHLKQRQDHFCTTRWCGRDAHYLTTRQFPQRAADIIGTGSLYWVIKGQITLRQPILHLEKATDDEGQSMTVIMLDPAHIMVQPTPRRPFQGWRYLVSADAPPDMDGAHTGLDPALMRQLTELGLV